MNIQHDSRPLASGALTASLIALGLLHGCGGSDVDEASRPQYIQSAFVMVGTKNETLARVITNYAPPAIDGAQAACPIISVDGGSGRMTLRSAPATAALRPTASDPADSKPSVFPVTVCEQTIPASAKSVNVAGVTLPLPKTDPQRIIVFGDSGCRMKKADNAWQSCGDTTAWPFEKVANAAAALKPDLVLHVGDYHYRENACPSDIAGCKGSPWGYGWDTWRADLFKPAAKLLAAAPWVMVRGNHEECARAGQGWFRFLDPQPFSANRSCDLAMNDVTANYSDPYAVKLGADTQVIVFDSAKNPKVALKPEDTQFAIYQKQFRQVADIAAKSGLANNIFTNHHPILAFAPIAGAKPAQASPALTSVMSSLYAQAYYPPGVNLALHGHVHNFQAISFKTGQTATIVSGTAGDNLDVALPDPLTAQSEPAPGAVIDHISHHASFGFLLMERRAKPSTGWSFKAYSADGKLLATCLQQGYALSCDKSGFITP
ncbi:serine/threonine protein phosphatase [Diaphorobacter sp. HDW4B]|uniref:metallophosphoesterase family protein n=1 Tax=Diaphorobacter sp. HDW4B TaxID=2714925 RepID=UPI00140E86DD|nr:metallophosphoesterase [Diaphorobacter sp. HDW4B]QIL69384.1 serine/threonine protein phosphatase [Diaphorobacter sp. HDW4B]